jgi:hypothetical protein
MKRLTFFLLAIVLIFAFALLASSNRARPAHASESTQPAQANRAEPCGCSTACMGGKRCAIKCPEGKAAHCECEGGTTFSPQEAKCYCR